MRPSLVRAILALSVVGVFMFITGFMAIYPLVSKTQVGLGDYADFFAKTASVYTGIIGVIVGYYFGRSEETRERRAAQPGATATSVENRP
jgi:uncharacterized BrkB/YihY/UPF0761 family membrane protein